MMLVLSCHGGLQCHGVDLTAADYGAVAILSEGVHSGVYLTVPHWFLCRQGVFGGQWCGKWVLTPAAVVSREYVM